jgi:hypothetical protein
MKEETTSKQGIITAPDQTATHEVAVSGEGSESKLISMIDPAKIMQFGLRLKAYIQQNKLSVEIKGRHYAMTDGWKFAGMNFGIVPIASKPIRIEQQNELLYVLKKKVEMNGRNGKYTTLKVFMSTTNKTLFEENMMLADEYTIIPYYAYECSCDLKSINTGNIIGQGHAVCTNAESGKTDFDMYAVASMSQTRAIGKAYRNLIGYIMNAAGYETTTAEEADGSMNKETSHATTQATTPIQPEQVVTILELIERLMPHALSEETNQIISSIKEKVHTFSKERGDMCIEYLNKEIAKTKTEQP